MVKVIYLSIESAHVYGLWPAGLARNHFFACGKINGVGLSPQFVLGLATLAQDDNIRFIILPSFNTPILFLLSIKNQYKPKLQDQQTIHQKGIKIVMPFWTSANN